MLELETNSITYNSLFNTEEITWTSNLNDSGGWLPQTKEPTTSTFTPLVDCFEKYDVPLIGIDVDYQMRYNKKTMDDLRKFYNTF